MAKSNRLLALLSEEELRTVEPHMENVALPLGMELSLPNKVDRYCYFPVSGVGSTVVVSPEGHQAEIGVFGCEGMSPVSAVLGSDRNPFRIVMQIEGGGYRILRDKLTVLSRELPGWQSILLRWAQAFTSQIAETALSNSVHSIDERLARWILMCHDRLNRDEIPLTHEFLSIMLAVRRPSVTTSLHVLEGNRLIYAQRGMIIMRDRKGLEAFAADAYGTSEQEYNRLLKPDRTPFV